MFLLLLSFMLGLSLLLPWNSLLKCLPYIMTRVPEEWRATAPLWLTLTFTSTNCLVLLALTFTDFDSRIIRKYFIGSDAQIDKVIGCRLYGGLVGCALLLLLACTVPLSDLKNSISGTGTMSCLLLFVGIFILTGLTMCLLQRSVYPMMSLLPGKKEALVSAMLTGQAVAGIAASLGSFMISGNVGGGGGAVMAVIYFACSIGALLTTALLYHFNGLPPKRKTEKLPMPEVSNTFSLSVLLETFKAIKPWPILLSLNFAITLSIFPGLLTSSARSLQSNKYFIPLTFLVFDVFDLIGKVMPSMTRCGSLGPKSRVAMALPIVRIAFIPVFLLLPNLGKVDGIQSDWLYFVMVLMMAWTSGWGNAICLINGAQSVNSDSLEEMGDRIGSLMGLSITFGLLCGSGSSFLLSKIN